MLERLRALFTCSRASSHDGETPCPVTSTQPTLTRQPAQTPPVGPSLRQRDAAPARSAQSPVTTAAGSAWQSLKKGVLQVALITAVVVVALALASQPLSWALIGCVLLGVAVGRALIGFVDWQTQRDERALSALYA